MLSIADQKAGSVGSELETEVLGTTRHHLCLTPCHSEDRAGAAIAGGLLPISCSTQQGRTPVIKPDTTLLGVPRHRSM